MTGGLTRADPEISASVSGAVDAGAGAAAAEYSASDVTMTCSMAV